MSTGNVHFSRRWCEMLGYTVTQVKPHVSAWEELLHPEDVPGVMAALEAHFAGRSPQYQTEHRLRRRDGSWAWVLDRGKVVEWTREGRPARMVGTHVDITSERQQALVLEASHAKLQGLFEVSPLALALADLDGTIVDANPAAHEITGHAPGALRGRRLGELVTPESAPALWARVRALDSGTGGGDVEFELVRADGECLPVRAHFARVVDEDGRARTWIVAQDLRAARRAEAALRESEARFRSMADQAPALIWMTDEAGRCTYVNEGWERFTGTRPESALGDGWIAQVHPDDRVAAATAIREAVLSGSPLKIEYRVRRRDGAWRWVQSSATPRREHAGTHPGYVGLTIDVTDAREARRLLEEEHARFAPSSGTPRSPSRCSTRRCATSRPAGSGARTSTSTART